MKRMQITAFLAAAALAAVSCGITNPLTGGSNMKTAPELWPDVPTMEGLAPSQLEMPLYVKLMMRTAANQILGRGGKDSGDWIVFTTTKSRDDIKNFYTPSRMAANGWEKTEKSTCFNGSEKGIPQVGLVCVFAKHSGNKNVGLMIVSAEDQETKELNIFFIRVEATADEEGQQPAQGAPKMTETPVPSSADIAAPYGIDKRPMPSGVDLDQLLPRQVGPYLREGVRLSSNQSVQPSAIEIDGNSVYADYRSASATIFVEFGASSTATGAHQTLDVAAGDAAGGLFPTDPRFGARGRDPSYLKVINADGAFFAWTRGGYFFSASSKSGEAALDAFMQAFPY